MKTRLFATLAVAAALLVGGPAFAGDNRGGGSSGGGGRGAFAGGGGGRVSAFSGGGGFASGRAFSSAPGVAFGGRGYDARGYAGGGGGRYGGYAFASHSGWSPGRQYFLNGHNYGYYNNGWYIVDPYPYYYSSDDYDAPGYTVYGPSYYDSSASADDTGSPVARVQRELARDGYYKGQIDGILGAETDAAIGAYQRDNGLHVTGTINSGLLNALDLN